MWIICQLFYRHILNFFIFYFILSHLFLWSFELQSLGLTLDQKGLDNHWFLIERVREYASIGWSGRTLTFGAYATFYWQVMKAFSPSTRNELKPPCTKLRKTPSSGSLAETRTRPDPSATALQHRNKEFLSQILSLFRSLSLWTRRLAHEQWRA